MCFCYYPTGRHRYSLPSPSFSSSILRKSCGYLPVAMAMATQKPIITVAAPCLDWILAPGSNIQYDAPSFARQDCPSQSHQLFTEIAAVSPGTGLGSEITTRYSHPRLATARLSRASAPSHCLSSGRLPAAAGKPTGSSVSLMYSTSPTRSAIS